MSAVLKMSNPVPSLTAVVRKALNSTLSSAVSKTRSKEAKITGKYLIGLLQTQIPSEENKTHTEGTYGKKVTGLK